ncbi:MAG: chorismate synthase [Burkholderiales bacterium]|nr:chorismate synthase [Burkholderiales bacterium]
MAGNSFGKIFRITTCGESHGKAIGVIIDGCPSGLAINEEDIQIELDRRKPGQSILTTPRQESDLVHILSGVFNGVTTGTPILLIIYNKDAKSEDYAALKDIFRPSHADFTYLQKYGIRDYRGSGRASARETAARVAAGAIAKKFLHLNYGIEVLSFVDQVGSIKANIDHNAVNLAAIEANLVRCPDKAVVDEMVALIAQLKAQGDSIGGVIKCVIRNVPAGLGEPVFDKLQADLAKAMLSINAAKGFEIGSGFAGVEIPGSIHNDPFVLHAEKVTKKTNNAGGVIGGISDGDDIYFRVGFKSVSTINKEQNTLDINYKQVKVKAEGRHDPCVLPRAVPVVDAMAALVIIDHLLRHHIYINSKGAI